MSTTNILDLNNRIDGLTASDVAYDNTGSGVTATDVQGAVDKLANSYPAAKVMLSDGVTSVEDALDAVIPKTVHTVTADGVKTYAQLLIELANKGAGGNALKIGGLTHSIVNQSNYFACYFSGGNILDVVSIYMTTSAAIYKCAAINNNGTVSWIDMSNDVPTSGTKIEKVII